MAKRSIGLAILLFGCALLAGSALISPKKFAENSSCMLRGGLLQKIGAAQHTACIHYFIDAGKLCSDGSQCFGDCIVKRDVAWIGQAKNEKTKEFSEIPDISDYSERQGHNVLRMRTKFKYVCAANDDPFGCRSVVKGGKVAIRMCLD